MIYNSEASRTKKLALGTTSIYFTTQSLKNKFLSVGKVLLMFFFHSCHTGLTSRFMTEQCLLKWVFLFRCENIPQYALCVFKWRKTLVAVVHRISVPRGISTGRRAALGA